MLRLLRGTAAALNRASYFGYGGPQQCHHSTLHGGDAACCRLVQISRRVSWFPQVL